MPFKVEDLAPEMAAAAKRLTADLQRAAGKNLAGLILYGFPLTGRRRSRSRIIKVVVLLYKASEKKLAALEPVIRNRWASTQIEATVLTREEVALWKETFATRFLDIRNRYVVLAGTDTFAEIKLSRPHVRMQVAENLRKMLLRLRCDRVELGGDGPQLASSLARIVRPFSRQLMFLLQLLNYTYPADDGPGIIFYAAAPVFGLDYRVLKRLARMRRNRPTANSVAGLYDRALAVIAQAADFAARMKDPSEGPAPEVQTGEASNVGSAAPAAPAAP